MNQNELAEYQPKGGMCAVCENCREDCSDLLFNTMPVIGGYEQVKIVRCTEFTKDSEDQNWF